jgi:hypothetical protein
LVEPRGIEPLTSTMPFPWIVNEIKSISLHP